MPDVLFVNGNSGLNIKSGEAILSEKEKLITKAVFGIGEKSERVLGKGVVKNYGKGKDGNLLPSGPYYYIIDRGDDTKVEEGWLYILN